MDVRYWHKADIPCALTVRCWTKADVGNPLKRPNWVGMMSPRFHDFSDPLVAADEVIK